MDRSNDPPHRPRRNPANPPSEFANPHGSGPTVEKFLYKQGKALPDLPERKHRPACPSPIRMYDSDTGEAFDMACKRRLCTVCGPTRWRPRVMAKLHSGLHGPIDDYLVVLLTAPGDVSSYEFNRRASFYWNRFWTSAARYWPGVSYWKVAELQRRGHIHFHIVLRGVSFIEIERLRRLAIRSGFGAWVGVARPSDYPRGVDGAASYLSKYLLKDYQRGTEGPTFVTMSRDWPTEWQSPVKRASGDRPSWITYYDLRRLKMNAQTAPRIMPRKDPPASGSLPPGSSSLRGKKRLLEPGPPGLFDGEEDPRTRPT